MENTDPQFQQLHPNLARLAVRYDDVYTQWRSGQISGEKARALMASLTERDDQGVRWGIDPDTGRFVRVTAFDAVEYDTPPTSGVLTPDAFAYSGSSRSDDPSLRLRVFSDESMQRPAAPGVGPVSGSGGRWWKSRRVQVGAVAVAAAVLVVAGADVVSGLLSVVVFQGLR